MGNFSITQYGNPLDKSKYTIDLDTKVFSSNQHNLVLDFNYLTVWTFKTGSHCIFNTGMNSSFNTGDSCIFNTGMNCSFNTGDSCTFKTYSDCTFITGDNCTFNTGMNCTFNTGDSCIFNTGHNCTFNTGRQCTFTTASDCTFNTGKLCTFLIYHINTCKFKSYEDISTILDCIDNKHYLLTKELIKMLKVKNG